MWCVCVTFLSHYKRFITAKLIYIALYGEILVDFMRHIYKMRVVLYNAPIY